MCWHKLIRVIRSSPPVVPALKMEAIVFVPSPPLSFDILTYPRAQRETESASQIESESQREREGGQRRQHGAQNSVKGKENGSIFVSDTHYTL